ncbi:MAG: hypothetical protein HQK72_13420 [Desulfamplus sp.]|nr:hypothetical protein [Desulfamplus sp.]
MGKKNLDRLDYTEQFSGGYEGNRLRSKYGHYRNIMGLLKFQNYLKIKQESRY